MKKVELKNISVSKLRLYLRCPLQYYYAYGEGIFQKTTKAARFGSYIHAVLENYVKHLLITGKQQDMEALYGIVSKKKKEFEEIPGTGELSFFDADVILNRFASKNINPLKVYAVEKFFQVPFYPVAPDPVSDGAGKNDEISINGRIDRIDIERYKEGGLLHIIDYKTGKNELTEKELKGDIQMKFYVTAAYFLYRKIYKRFRFSLYYLRHGREVNFETDYRDEYGEELRNHISAVSKDTDYKKNVTKLCCYCPAFKICKPDMSKIPLHPPFNKGGKRGAL